MWVSINDMEDTYIDSLCNHYDLNISKIVSIHDEIHCTKKWYMVNITVWDIIVTSMVKIM